MHLHFTPRQIVEKLDQYIIGQKRCEESGCCSFKKSIPPK